MKLSKLITHLNKIKKEFGDREMYLSSDPEGNSYSTIHAPDSFCVDKDISGKDVLVLFPWEENIDLF